MILLEGHSSALGTRVNLSRGTQPICRPDMVSVAFHEAGHAVIASVFGLPVLHASILADVETLGRVWFAPESWNAVPLDVHLLTLLSGQIAQDDAACRYGLPFVHFDALDVVAARLIVAQHLDARDWHAVPVDAELQEWRERVGHSVNASWAWILRVAGALVERKCLTGKEVEGLRR